MLDQTLTQITALKNRLDTRGLKRLFMPCLGSYQRHIHFDQVENELPDEKALRESVRQSILTKASDMSDENVLNKYINAMQKYFNKVLAGYPEQQMTDRLFSLENVPEENKTKYRKALLSLSNQLLAVEAPF